LLQLNAFRGVVIAEKTRLSRQYFVALQKFVVLELGLVLVPVSQQTEAAGLLVKMVSNTGSARIEGERGGTTFP
jgi:hypothetical protein